MEAELSQIILLPNLDQMAGI